MDSGKEGLREDTLITFRTERGALADRPCVPVGYASLHHGQCLAELPLHRFEERPAVHQIECYGVHAASKVQEKDGEGQGLPQRLQDQTFPVIEADDAREKGAVGRLHRQGKASDCPQV
jgi:hypothetical protein